MRKTPQNSEDISNCLCGDNIYDIHGVEDIEYPVELNSFIIVMKSGKKYIVTVNEYTEST